MDSSDFSVLSDPRRQSSGVQATLSALRAFIATGKVRCYFSGTHLTEMAPVDAVYSDAADCRAALVEELCGRNAVVSQEELFKGELRHAHRFVAALPCVFSHTGDWFPSGMAELSPVGLVGVANTSLEAIQDLPLNREGRRRAKRKLLQDGQPRRAFRIAATDSLRSEILEQYPMRLQDAHVLSRFAIGDASAFEAEEAFLNSLRDPRWMMGWFRQHHAEMSPLVQSLREASASFACAVEEMATRAKELLRQNAFLHGSSVADRAASDRWMNMQDELLEQVVARMTSTLIGPGLPALAARDVDEMCPGISTGIRSLYSPLWTTMSLMPRMPKPSDFPDAMHAVYAPYVDFFRADAFMAPHIRKQTERFGSKIFSKLTELAPAIEVSILELEARAQCSGQDEDSDGGKQN